MDEMAPDADLRKEIKTHVTIVEAHVPNSVIKTAVIVAALADRGRYVSMFVPRMNKPTGRVGVEDPKPRGSSGVR